MVFLKFLISLLIFCLTVKSIIESGVLTFPTTIVELSTLNLVTLFIFFFLLHVFGALFSGAYMSAIVDSFMD